MPTNDEGHRQPPDLHWDDVVDTVCAGSGPGVLAYAIRCADLDQDVQLVDAESPAHISDAATAEFLEALVEDLGPPTRYASDLELPVTRAEPVPATNRRRGAVEPFVGGRLRDWSARCLASPFGVIHTDVSEADVTAMRTSAGELIQAAVIGTYRPRPDRPGAALTDWLAGQARERGIVRSTGVTLRRLIFQYGRVAGVELETASGTRLVRTTAGVALSTRPAPAGADWPGQPGLRDVAVKVAVVGRRAGRFGRVELLSGIDQPA